MWSRLRTILDFFGEFGREMNCINELRELMKTDVEAIGKYATSSFAEHRKTPLGRYFLCSMGKRNRSWGADHLPYAGSMGSVR